MIKQTMSLLAIFAILCASAMARPAENTAKDLETANSFYGLPGYGLGYGYYGGYPAYGGYGGYGGYGYNSLAYGGYGYPGYYGGYGGYPVGAYAFAGR